MAQSNLSGEARPETRSRQTSFASNLDKPAIVHHGFIAKWSRVRVIRPAPVEQRVNGYFFSDFRDSGQPVGMRAVQRQGRRDLPHVVAVEMRNQRIIETSNSRRQ